MRMRESGFELTHLLRKLEQCKLPTGPLVRAQEHPTLPAIYAQLSLPVHGQL